MTDDGPSFADCSKLIKVVAGAEATKANRPKNFNIITTDT